MIPDERLERFRLLFSTAHARLGSGADEPFARMRGLRRMFRLARYPARGGGDPEVYQLLLWHPLQEKRPVEDRTIQRWLATRRIWRMGLDTQKLEQEGEDGRGSSEAPSPTIESTCVDVDPALAEATLSSFRAVSIPLPGESLAMIGSFSLLHLDWGDELTHVRVRWHPSLGPRNWTPLTEACQGFLDAVSRLQGWEPVPAPEPPGEVSIRAAWATGKPSAAELTALRTLVPAMAMHSLRELAGKNGRLPIAPLAWIHARDLRSRAAELGLRLELES